VSRGGASGGVFASHQSKPNQPETKNCQHTRFGDGGCACEIDDRQLKIRHRMRRNQVDTDVLDRREVPRVTGEG
ncbi:MAG: hypothetical protein P8M28_01165, partial [Alphaproteobacteria bacterium]|nr:hypothetical protein [Alphaproteobacteria bacterium]